MKPNEMHHGHKECMHEHCKGHHCHHCPHGKCMEEHCKHDEHGKCDICKMPKK